MHQRRLWWAAPQHGEVTASDRNGPKTPSMVIKVKVWKVREPDLGRDLDHVRFARQTGPMLVQRISVIHLDRGSSSLAVEPREKEQLHCSG